MSAAEAVPIKLGRAEYARLLHQAAVEIRELKSCVSPGFRSGVERLAAKIDYLASTAGQVDWVREPTEQERYAAVQAPIRRPDYKRTSVSREKNPEPGMRNCSKCHSLLPLDMFTVTDAKTGKRRADCKVCYNESQRTRYVRAGYKIVTIEVLDGDPCVGHLCPDCGKPFEVGQHIQADNLRHEDCDPAHNDAEAAPYDRGDNGS